MVSIALRYLEDDFLMCHGSIDLVLLAKDVSVKISVVKRMCTSLWHNRA